MKALILNLIIVIGITMMAGGCEKNKVNPCVRGVLVEKHANCYLIIQVLNVPIGSEYVSIPDGTIGQTAKTYSNAVGTKININANQYDTIYFRYRNMGNIDCGLRYDLYLPPDVPLIEILSYDSKNCPQ